MLILSTYRQQMTDNVDRQINFTEFRVVADCDQLRKVRGSQRLIGTVPRDFRLQVFP